MIYIICLIFIIANSMIFHKNKKMFVISTFLILFFVSSLRKYTIGIDLEAHYIKNYIYYGELPWKTVFNLAKEQSFYDYGLILFMKFLSVINPNPQFFIIITSFIINFIMGRYIYKHSQNPCFETLLFYTTFAYFMYMNIIAQALAISIIILSIDFLIEKKYFKYIIFVFIASSIHSSALICLGFIPLFMLKSNKKSILLFCILIVIFVLSFDTLLPYVLENIFPQFAYYIKSNKVQNIDYMQFIYTIFYICCLLSAIVFRENPSKKTKKVRSKLVNSNFLIYMCILSIVFRFMGMYSYIFSRVGFYFYPFACSLLASSIIKIKDYKFRFVINVICYTLMILFFVVLFDSLKVSYGVFPYEFFWE